MRRALTTLLLFAVAACGGDKTTGPNAAIGGTYTLETVNGKSLPAVLIEDTEEKDEVTAGSIFLGPNSRWNIELTLLVTDLTDHTAISIGLATTGSYTTNGSSITLTGLRFAAPLTGTVNGDKLTVVGDVLGTPATLVFNKQ